MIVAALIALLVIECAYFITMLVIARPWSTKPAVDTTTTDLGSASSATCGFRESRSSARSQGPQALRPVRGQ